ncbi:hypothetical protein ACRAWF_27860 [Streptomyces sp. L7]
MARPGHGTLVRALGAAGETVGDTTFLVGDDGAEAPHPGLQRARGPRPRRRDSGTGAVRTAVDAADRARKLSARAAASDSGGAAGAPGAAAQCGTGGSGPGGTGSGPAAIAGRVPVSGGAGAPQSRCELQLALRNGELTNSRRSRSCSRQTGTDPEPESAEPRVPVKLPMQ